MNKKTLILLTAMILGAGCITGCKKSDTADKQADNGSATTVMASEGNTDKDKVQYESYVVKQKIAGKMETMTDPYCYYGTVQIVAPDGGVVKEFDNCLFYGEGNTEKEYKSDEFIFMNIIESMENYDTPSQSGASACATEYSTKMFSLEVMDFTENKYNITGAFDEADNLYYGMCEGKFAIVKLADGEMSVVHNYVTAPYYDVYAESMQLQVHEDETGKYYWEEVHPVDGSAAFYLVYDTDFVVVTMLFCEDVSWNYNEGNSVQTHKANGELK